MDELVDEWSLRQIEAGNKDRRFMTASRAQRRTMMANGMFPLNEAQPQDQPCHPDPDDSFVEERRVRHPSEDIEI